MRKNSMCTGKNNKQIQKRYIKNKLAAHEISFTSALSLHIQTLLYLCLWAQLSKGRNISDLSDFTHFCWKRTWIETNRLEKIGWLRHFEKCSHVLLKRAKIICCILLTNIVFIWRNDIS